MKQSGNPHWWKLHEATMLALGSTQEVIERQLAAGRVKFDLAVFLQNVVLSNIASPGESRRLSPLETRGGKGVRTARCAMCTR